MSFKLPHLLIFYLPHALEIALPTYKTSGSAGFDLRAAIKKDKILILRPRERVLVPTGFIFEVPVGFEAQIRPRSGLALKYGVTCLNTPGTIDSDYRGEIQILLINLGDKAFHITRGMRIAQGIIAPVIQVEIFRSSGRSETERGEGGFGSTGYS